MRKTILITGATDGIGLETAKTLARSGHKILLHGRNPQKLEQTLNTLSATVNDGDCESYLADFSQINDVAAIAKAISAKHKVLDVLINNAGIFKTNQTQTNEGFDVRFIVNTVAPYLLTKRLFPLFEKTSRIINLSSAAQSPVDIQALKGKAQLLDMAAYAQSKLALTMWSRQMALTHPEGPVIVAINPASMLGSKMVKEAFGVVGGDLKIGADILCRAALSEDFANASGKYFDNDQQRFGSPHPDALDTPQCEAVVDAIESILKTLTT